MWFIWYWRELVFQQLPRLWEVLRQPNLRQKDPPCPPWSPHQDQHPLWAQRRAGYPSGLHQVRNDWMTPMNKKPLETAALHVSVNANLCSLSTGQIGRSPTSSTGPAVKSPGQGLRLGLSRLVRVKPLHPSVASHWGEPSHISFCPFKKRACLWILYYFIQPSPEYIVHFLRDPLWAHMWLPPWTKCHRTSAGCVVFPLESDVYIYDHFITCYVFGLFFFFIIWKSVPFLKCSHVFLSLDVRKQCTLCKCL